MRHLCDEMLGISDLLERMTFFIPKVPILQLPLSFVIFACSFFDHVDTNIPTMTLTSHAQKNANKRFRLAAEAVGTSTRHHEDPQRGYYAPKTDRSFPLEGSSIADNYDSPTTGQHSSKLENKADPGTDSDGSRTLGNTGYGTTSGEYVGSATPPTTGYGPESRQYEQQHHGHQYGGFGQSADNTKGSVFGKPTTSSPTPFGTSPPAQSKSSTGQQSFHNPKWGININLY